MKNFKKLIVFYLHSVLYQEMNKPIKMKLYPTANKK